MIGLFKQKTPANLMSLLVVGILIKLPAFFNPHPPLLREGDGVLYHRLLEILQPASASFGALFPLLAFALLFVQAVTLTRFVNNHRMMARPNYLPGLSYMVLTSLLPEWNYFSAPLLVNSVLLYVLTALFNTYNRPQARGTIFNIGLALGIASFLFVPSLVFGLWILLALAILRPFRIDEWLLCLLGITTPFYFYAVYIFLNDRWDWNTLLPHISVALPSLKQSAWLAGSIFLVMVPFMAGGYYIQEHLRRMLIHVRKAWSLLLLYLLVGLLIPFVNTSNTLENWIMALMPMAAFHGFAYFYAKWKALPVIVFWLSVAFILCYQYAGPGWR